MRLLRGLRAIVILSVIVELCSVVIDIPKKVGGHMTWREPSMVVL